MSATANRIEKSRPHVVHFPSDCFSPSLVISYHAGGRQVAFGEPELHYFHGTLFF